MVCLNNFLHNRKTRTNSGMYVLCPNLCFRSINQEAVHLDPNVQTQKVRTTVRSHCKSQSGAMGADSRNNYAVSSREMGERADTKGITRVRYMGNCY